jgi:hypothetical protein
VLIEIEYTCVYRDECSYVYEYLRLYCVSKKIVDLFEIQAECVFYLTRYHIASVRLDRNHNGRLSDHIVVSSIR